MTRPTDQPPPSDKNEPERVFTVAEFEADMAMVHDYAAKTGCATVVDNDDGRVRLVITIPNKDLPTFDG